MKVRVEWDAGRKRWRVETHAPTGDPSKPYRRVRQFKATREAAEAEARAQRAMLAAHGAMALDVDPVRYARLVELEARCAAAGGTLEEAVEAWAARRRPGEVPLEQAIEDFLASRRAAGVVPAWERKLARYLQAFYDYRGARALGSITPGEVAASVDAAGGCAETRANRLRALGTFFRWCVRQGWVPEAPTANLPRPRVRRPEPRAVPAADVDRLMGHLWREAPELVPFAALRFFAGIRTSGVLRADWADVRPGEAVVLPAVKAKSGRRTYLDHLPENLWPWLAPFQTATGRIALSHYPARFAAEARRCGVQVARNAPRHSFATYHVAAFRDPARTAVLLGHRRDPAVLWEHYAGAAAADEARRFFAILPPTTCRPGARPTSPS